MKHTLQCIAVLVTVTVFLAACNKVKDLPYYANGTPTTLASTVKEIAATPTDSLKDVVTFSWNNPKYATDSANTKYVLQIDSAGRNFAKAYERVITGAQTTTFTAKEINDILLGFGFAYNTAYNVDVRVISSYANNNERLNSNTLTIKMTPYKTPPKVVPPAFKMLFIVGSATAGGWGNPVPVPAQEFTVVDSVTYEGNFYLNGGGEYLLLPVNGSWDSKFAVADNSVAGLSNGGDFGFYSNANPTAFNSNFPAPATSGIYKIHIDFQRGKFSVTPVKSFDYLYVPGDYQGWTPATAPALASPNKDGKYEGYVNVGDGGSYEFKLTTAPNWDNAYGDGGNGTLSTSGGNLKFTSGGGYYKINASTVDNTWSVMKTSWSAIGNFSNWSSDADLTYDAGSKSWSTTVTATADGEFKFRANHDWGLNYGDDGADGSLEQNGANLKLPAGTHKITLYLGNAGYYTYKIE